MKKESVTLHARMASKIELWPLERLRPYDRNPRTHSPEQVEQIAASIVEFGFNNPVLVDSTDGIIAGHGRLLAAKRLALTQVPVVVLDHLTDAQRRAYVIADNKLAEAAGWDSDLLAGELAALREDEFDLSAVGFSDDELADLLGGWDDLTGTIDEGDVPEPPEHPVSVHGDLWLLGDHRVLCGDAAEAEDVARLMAGQVAEMVVTDPPYNIDYGNIKHPKFKSRSIANDDMSEEDHGAFCRRWTQQVKAHCRGCVYVFGPPGPDGRVMFRVLDEILHCSTTIIWNKDAFTLGRGKYQNKHEPVWFGWNESGSRFVDDRRLTNVWDVARPKCNDLHPTMKPIELISMALGHASRRGDVVLDLFGGSGTTLMACEQMGRGARLLELAPAYVDVIVERWQSHTGREAKLDGDGRSFGEISDERLAQ